MYLPPQYFWLEPVLLAAAVVFVVDLISNTITFSNRGATFSSSFLIRFSAACRFVGLFNSGPAFGPLPRMRAR